MDLALPWCLLICPLQPELIWGSLHWAGFVLCSASHGRVGEARWRLCFGFRVTRKLLISTQVQSTRADTVWVFIHLLVLFLVGSEPEGAAQTLE